MLKFQCIGCLLMLAFLYAVSSLKCYRCGTYNQEGTGSVSPCYDFNQTHLKDCSPSENSCMKYTNKGIVVRQCINDCKPQEGDMEVYCCQTDGCNGSRPIRVEIVPEVAAVISIVLLLLLH
ncbi:uncharacterized protein LOC143229306 [Tachypleus tridentatus]|uniref:uncharacterized protein LOC143229306 n=1 Tax=Tachypleus tridentatus TaxID=6853 RepID=UPI003FD694A5